MSLYFIINLASVAVPFLFSFHPRLAVHKTWFALWPGIIVAGIPFVLWDLLYTHWGVWGFNPRYLQGTYIGNLPVEEVLFFICVPYCCLFTYACFKKLLDLRWTDSWAKPGTFILVPLLFGLTLLFPGRLYTNATFVATAIFLLIHYFWLKSPWLGRFYFSWVILQFPFLIVNGLLTGSFIEDEIVWYNNAENMGVRIATIPVEDTMYGMLLVLIAITVYEALLLRRERKTHAG